MDSLANHLLLADRYKYNSSQPPPTIASPKPGTRASSPVKHDLPNQGSSVSDFVFGCYKLSILLNP